MVENRFNNVSTLNTHCVFVQYLGLMGNTKITLALELLKKIAKITSLHLRVYQKEIYQHKSFG